jgi:hypothetical protein
MGGGGRAVVPAHRLRLGRVQGGRHRSQRAVLPSCYDAQGAGRRIHSADPAPGTHADGGSGRRVPTTTGRGGALVVVVGATPACGRRRTAIAEEGPVMVRVPLFATLLKFSPLAWGHERPLVKLRAYACSVGGGTCRAPLIHRQLRSGVCKCWPRTSSSFASATV